VKEVFLLFGQHLVLGQRKKTPLLMQRCFYVGNSPRKSFGEKGGEYRSRTDDLLHAMQAL
jgi:hypothetical protein